MSLGEEVVEDYASLRFSLKAHPVSFLRARLAAEGMVETARLLELANGGTVKVAGLVLVRQRPGTAKGVIFATLEDETGVANIIVWPDVFARCRKTVLAARLLGVEGPLQREGLVTHVIARRLFDLTPRLAALRDPCVSIRASWASRWPPRRRHATQRLAPGHTSGRAARRTRSIGHGISGKLKDLAQWILEEFRISLDETTVGRELKALGFVKISARPRHYAQNELAIEDFKKTFPPRWRRSEPRSRPIPR